MKDQTSIPTDYRADILRWVEEVEEADREAPEAPWAWSFSGDKSNEFCVGLACDIKGRRLRGQVEGDDLVDPVLIGEGDGSGAAEWIALSRTALVQAARGIRAEAQEHDVWYYLGDPMNPRCTECGEGHTLWPCAPLLRLHAALFPKEKA